MHLKAVITFIIILLFCLPSRGQQQDGSVFERRITIHAQNQPLSTILNQISWQAKVYFSYNASSVEASQNYSFTAVDKSLFSILNQLFDPREYLFKELDNQIIILKKDTEYNPLVKTDSIPVKYFFLTGKILDRKKESPVPYASVSVKGKPIGTISNLDGEFLLKIHPDYINDTLLISSMGFAQVLIPAHRLLDEDLILMKPVSIRIREVKVTAITPEQLLENIRSNFDNNYSPYIKLMNAFYRETVKQDGEYINVSEAVIEILKAPYTSSRADLSRLIKGRQSPDVQPFKWLNFKLQGGPFTITQLDIVKTMESFINENHEHQYEYKLTNVIWYNDNPVYILEFEPVNGLNFHGFVGELYVHRETFAIVHARFGFNRHGLKKAAPILVKHTPPGVKARPSFVEYQVNYQKYQGKWHLATARANIKFKIRSRRDKINSEFHSISEILVTDIQSTELKKFRRSESFSYRDIFA
ncbi:MAG: carboxypeptidase-like regulatory domain-containing protein [Bacteroidota bacterium]